MSSSISLKLTEPPSNLNEHMAWKELSVLHMPVIYTPSFLVHSPSSLLCLYGLVKKRVWNVFQEALKSALCFPDGNSLHECTDSCS